MFLKTKYDRPYVTLDYHNTNFALRLGMTLTTEVQLLKAEVKLKLWLKHHIPLLLIFLVLMVAVSVPFPTKGAETLAQKGTEVGESYSVPDLCTLADVHCEDETVEGRIRIAVRKSGINEDTAIRIAKCESSLNPLAKHSISTAKGLFMFTDPTWQFTGAKGSQFDEAESIKQFIKWYPKKPQWWECK